MNRLPAEWECAGAVMMAWPHAATDWAGMLPEVHQCYLSMMEAIAPRVKRLLLLAPEPCELPPLPQGVRVVRVPTNDTWTRDYGPITIQDDNCLKICDFKFNGWGLKFAADKDNMVNSRVFPALVDHREFVLEGGSIESDGRGTILTTSRCLLSPNRNGSVTRRHIARLFNRWLGSRKLLWLNHGGLAGDDTDGHVDTLARLCPDGRVLYVKCDDPGDEHYDDLQAMESELKAMKNVDGERFKLVPLPLPRPIYDPDGERLPATYANYLVLEHAVIMPTYGQPDLDELAREHIQRVFVDYEVVGVDCRALIRQHGSLHCATMQLPVEFAEKVED
ncbi:MAG: agmatine deiminase family protein [Bacteroidales bacterium]|nr:agmatine deiminase family protein [Bacteroidales bacterium]